MTGFGQLALIVLAGLGGPLLAASRKVLVPVVVGELLAGVALGKTGAGLVKPDDVTIAFLGNVGFAMLMLHAGMHVPLRSPELFGSLRRGASAVVASAALGIGGGLAIAHGLDLGHPAVWAVLLATGSAAIVVPALEEARISAELALPVMAWATIADIATIVAVPLVLNPSKAAKAALGAVAVVGGAAALLLVARLLARAEWVHGVRRLSRKREWALDLRLSLLVLFALCALAQWAGTSIVIAGFATGLVVAIEGGPKRLSRQVTGVGNGFLVPVFFVVLGASLDVRALLRTPHDLELAAALAAGVVAVHVLAARLTRQTSWTGLVVSAQLGVPAAVVKLGLPERVLTRGQGAAIIAAALVSLAMCSVGTMLGKRADERLRMRLEGR
jgi:Kef-type K+ transport system membrane component KefB